MKHEKQMIIIFGATGDLAKRKLIPALYRLHAHGITHIPIVCVGRRNFSQEEFNAWLQMSQFIGTENLSNFVPRLHYINITYDEAGMNLLKGKLESINKEYDCSGNKVFYIAMPPERMGSTVALLKKTNLTKGGFAKVAFEKPFGSDLTSSRNLNKYVSSAFKEDQIYRVDHYLGKELVQNILVFRFANAVFEQVWNRKYVDHVQITVSEDIGIEGRGPYYDAAGAIKDMLQNHLLQVLTLAAMEPPKSWKSLDIRNEKIKLLKNIKKIKPSEIVIGQYSEGKINGKFADAYRKERNVFPQSGTETYVAVKLNIANDRWKGIPFYLRTGKRLSRKYAEINVIFKDVSCKLFSEDKICIPKPNVITIRIQPDEGIAITFNAKSPNHGLQLAPVMMDYCHRHKFGLNSPEAYETILRSIFVGDQSLFTRWDAVEQSWKIIDPLEKLTQNKRLSFPNYKAGTDGPKESEQLLTNDGRKWIMSDPPPEHGGSK